MKYLVSAVLVLFTTISIYAQDVNVSNYLYFDSEPSLVVNPTDPSNLVAAWMSASTAYIQMKTSYSKDGGKTWSTPQAIAHTHPKYTSADPGLAFTKGGKVFFTYIDYMPNKDSGAIYIMNSSDGGQNWSSPSKVSDGTVKPDKPIDRPWLAIDNSGGKYDGRIYVCMKSVDIGAKPHHVWIRSSDDEGKTWSGIKLLDSIIPSDLIENNLAIPTVAPDGSLYTAYYSYHLKSSLYPRLILLRSTDGGATFNYSVIDSFKASSSVTDSLYQAGYTLAANPSDASNIVISWVDNVNGDPDIYSAYSSNYGKNWSKAVRVNDDTKSNGKGQDMVWGGFSASGTYGISWRDRRNTANGSMAAFDIYSAVSKDGGKSFSANIKLNSDTSKAINLSKGNDFIGTTLSNDSIHSCWAGLKSTFPDIYFNKAALSIFSGVSDTKHQEIKFFKIAPNPFADELKIECLQTTVESIQVIVYDLQGRQQFSKTYAPNHSNTLRIAFPGLPAGKYILRLISGKYSQEEKIEKQP